MEELNKYLSRLSEHHDMYVFFLGFDFQSRLSPVLCGSLRLTPFIGRRLDQAKASRQCLAKFQSAFQEPASLGLPFSIVSLISSLSYFQKIQDIRGRIVDRYVTTILPANISHSQYKSSDILTFQSADQKYGDTIGELEARVLEVAK